LDVPKGTGSDFKSSSLSSPALTRKLKETTITRNRSKKEIK
jgi:hypothetical protein